MMKFVAVIKTRTHQVKTAASVILGGAAVTAEIMGLKEALRPSASMLSAEAFAFVAVLFAVPAMMLAFTQVERKPAAATE